MKTSWRTRQYVGVGLALLAFIAGWGSRSRAEGDSETYSISLVKTADRNPQVRTVGDTRVVTEPYVVKRGDYIFKILRTKGVVSTRKEFIRILEVLKKLNPSLTNVDLIHPGQQLLIPLKIEPVTSGAGPAPPVPAAPAEAPTAVADLERVDFEKYTVKSGDTLFKVLRGKFRIPDADLYGTYLTLLRKLNPAIKDVNTIYPGQVVRLPIYTPTLVRKSITRAAAPGASPREPSGRALDASKPGPGTVSSRGTRTANPVGEDLAAVFTEMGEEWIGTGEHFIPLKSGGQINLKAASFPVINVRNGMRVIVDLNTRLPGKVAKLIESSWDGYRVVHLDASDTLRSSLQKVLGACGYPEVRSKGVPVIVHGSIPLSVGGDWVVTVERGASGGRPLIAALRVVEPNGAPIDQSIKEFLKEMGVTVIEYPRPHGERTNGAAAPTPLYSLDSPAALVEAVLRRTGRSFSTHLDIPAFQSRKADLQLIIKADFFLRVGGKDAIIDLTGLSPEVVSFLAEHRFATLPLAGETGPISMTGRLLEFLGVPFDGAPHRFLAAGTEEARTIAFTLPGIVFADAAGAPVFVTDRDIPLQIGAFLSRKGFNILKVSF